MFILPIGELWVLTTDAYTVRARGAGLGELGALLAALLTERDILARAAGADIHLRYLVLTGEAPPGVSANANRGVVYRVGQAARQLAGQLSRLDINDSTLNGLDNPKAHIILNLFAC
eukprot:scaffold288951_cov27-Prasinocladus_malaysianus.AAC.1